MVLFGPIRAQILMLANSFLGEAVIKKEFPRHVDRIRPSGSTRPDGPHDARSEVERSAVLQEPVAYVARTGVQVVAQDVGVGRPRHRAASTPGTAGTGLCRAGRGHARRLLAQESHPLPPHDSPPAAAVGSGMVTMAVVSTACAGTTSL